MELLFESRREIAILSGKLRWIQQRAKVHEQPVLYPSNSGDGAGASIYGSVLHDSGVYRMWYQGWRANWTGNNSAIVCYAESDDAVSWRKPELTLDDRFASPQNVTDLGLHAPSVFIDPDAPASHRYRAMGHSDLKEAGTNRSATGRGYRTAHSADGLHWKLDQPEPTWPGADVITSIYHPQQKRGVVAMKYTVRHGGIRRRSIWNSELRDGQWQRPWCAIIPDEFDDTCALSRGLASGDYYGMAMQPAGSGMAGFIWQFRHSLPRTSTSAGDGSGVFGVVDVSLAYQPDARSTWLHAPGRLDFISSSDAPWHPGGGVYTASAPIRIGDEDRLYLCVTYPHGWYVDDKHKVIEDAKARLVRRGMSQIGYAYWPADRLFGYTAEPEGTIQLHLGLNRPQSPMKLYLNCHTHNSDGFVKVAVNDNPSQSHENCQPLTGSHFAGAVTWKDGPVIQPSSDGFSTVTIQLNEATLWGWEIRPA